MKARTCSGVGAANVDIGRSKKPIVMRLNPGHMNTSAGVIKTSARTSRASA